MTALPTDTSGSLASHQAAETWDSKHVGPATVDWQETLADGDAPRSHGGHTIAGRYRLHETLGSGGQGQVMRATDALLGREVAVKIIQAISERSLRAARREVTALRQAVLPGVVPLLDDGLDGALWYFVMPVVRGTPFPGRPGPLPWSELRAPTLALLEILAGIHHAGLLHRDLKESNVLVDGASEVTVLDLGLAQALDDPRRSTMAGTPTTIAPEVVRGEAATVASDLYSLGAMLHAALTGDHPHPTENPTQRLARRAKERVPSLVGQVPGLPDPVAELIDQLLDPEPTARPGSALDLLASLGGALPGPLGNEPLDLPTTMAASPDELRRIFWGPDLFLHLPEDGARELWRRTGGEPGRVRRELAAWLRAGIGTWEGGRLRIRRQHLARLGALRPLAGEGAPTELAPVQREALELVALSWPGLTLEELARLTRIEALEDLEEAGLIWFDLQGRACTAVHPSWSSEPTRALGRLVAQDLPTGHPVRLSLVPAVAHPGAAFLEELLLRARELRLVASLDEVEEHLRLSLDHAQGQGKHEVELELLAARAELALAREAPLALEVALHDLGRTPLAEEPAYQPQLGHIQRLLWAARAVLAGDAAKARTALAELGPLPWEALEVWRRSLEVRVARFEGTEAAARMLEELATWAAQGPPLREAKRQGWLGNLRYAEGAYPSSAAHHLVSASGKEAVGDRVASRLNAMGATMEAFRYQEALELVEAAWSDARGCRSMRSELAACWVERQLVYRLDLPTRPRRDLVAAARGLHPHFSVSIALTEAAIAWRQGDTEARWFGRQAAASALPLAASGSPSSGRTAVTLMAHALHGLLEPGSEDRDQIAAQAEGLGPCELHAQILGLLLLGDWREDLAQRALAMLPGWRCPDPRLRLELLSGAEVRAAAERGRIPKTP